MSEIHNHRESDEMLEDYAALLEESHLAKAVRGKYYGKTQNTVSLLDSKEKINIYTVEATVEIEADGKLRSQISSPIAPGQYRAVILLESSLPETAAVLTSARAIEETTAEIQQLLQQLQQSNPAATELEKQAFIEIALSPTKREQLIEAFRVSGKEGLGAFLKQPYLALTITAIERWNHPARHAENSI